MTNALKDAFIAYDTAARRQALGLGALQGTEEQKAMCKRLGWDVVELYFDMVTGEEVQVTNDMVLRCGLAPPSALTSGLALLQYNEGCSEDDLWATGVPGYDERFDETKCAKLPRTPDMAFDWSVDPVETACWGNAQFKDYCSRETKCTYNGTKGRGTVGTGAKKWYDGSNFTHTGGKGTVARINCVRAAPAPAPPEGNCESDLPPLGAGFVETAAEVIWIYQGKLHVCQRAGKGTATHMLCPACGERRRAARCLAALTGRAPAPVCRTRATWCSFTTLTRMQRGPTEVWRHAKTKRDTSLVG